MLKTTGPYVQVTSMPEGVYRATCPAYSGIHADGTTPEEAERSLLEMLENRIEYGPLSAREPIELDPDATTLTDEL